MDFGCNNGPAGRRPMNVERLVSSSSFTISLHKAAGRLLYQASAAFQKPSNRFCLLQISHPNEPAGSTYSSALAPPSDASPSTPRHSAAFDSSATMSRLNLVFERRGADGKLDRLPQLAQETGREQDRCHRGHRVFCGALRYDKRRQFRQWPSRHGGRKAPRHEIAGNGAAAVPQALWGFGHGVWGDPVAT